MVDEQRTVLDKQKDAFVKEMEQAQLDFDENFESTRNTVASFA